MSMTDPVADLLTRIRNACMEKHDKVEAPASRLKANIVRVLKEEGFIKNFRLIRDDNGRVTIKIFLKYDDKGESVIRGIRRVSTPGLRRYSGIGSVPKVLGGVGISVLSTSKGVLANQKAAQNKVGGEIICEVW